MEHAIPSGMDNQRAPMAAPPALSSAQRPTPSTVWALGNYDAFARSTVWGLGATLVEACGVSPGQSLLDVATGTGNVAIRAAKAGARVVALDLTPEHFDAGRQAAHAEGVEVEWKEGDAQALPLPDQTFDIVTSCLGAIFAPDHQAVADELVRVCRRGGTIGMINFTPHGNAGRFFGLLAPHAPPPPPDAQPPLLWGHEGHVRQLFGDRVTSLAMTRHEYVETAASADAYIDLFRTTFGPMIAIRASLASQPEHLRRLDEAFRNYVTSANRSRPGEPVQIPYEYLLVIARK